MIATLRIVTIEKFKLKFLLILYFHVYTIYDEFFIAHWYFRKFCFSKHGNLVDVVLSNSLSRNRAIDTNKNFQEMFTIK